MRVPLKTRLKLVGCGILVVGFGVAAWVWVAQDRLERANGGNDEDETEMLAPLDSRKQVREMEIYYGKSGTMFEGWLEWLETLKHGKPLAYTIAVLSCILGGGCFLTAAYILPIWQTPTRQFDIASLSRNFEDKGRQEK